MTNAFERAASLSADGRASIDPSWYQGRGAFGGLLAALLLRGMRAKVAEPERVARTLTVHFCAPATEGPVRVEAEIVRSGSRVTHVTARVTRDAEVFAIASGSFCKSRQGPAWQREQMPEVRPPAEVPSLPQGFPGIPTFLDHLEAKFCGGTVPFTGGTVPEFQVWLRLREAAPLDASLAALLLDAPPPAMTATFAGPSPIATVDFTIHFFDRFEQVAAPDAFHLLTVESRWAADGYEEELRDLWSPEGRLLGQCRQLFAAL